jgi:hypothetical protein
MRIVRLALLSFFFLELFVTGIPVIGFAGTPHPCPGGVHQGPSLGGGGTKTFEFRKNCSPDSSYAVRWKATIYNDSTGAVVCSFPETALPPDTKSLTCSGVPQYVRIVLSYKTSILGGWMTHTETFTNP